MMNVLTLGNEPQSFLGAKWVERLLKLAPEKYKRPLALTALSWSPHYFLRKIDPEYQYLSHFEFTKREFERNKSTREKLCSYVLAPHLKSTQVVLDYGCGPGFLANIVSRHVRRVYGIDLSRGVLECARIFNSGSNITFLHTTQLSEIEDCSIDLVYSFAVIQHVTDLVFRTILTAMRSKLKKGGELIIHIVLDEDNRTTERGGRQDMSLEERLKLKYGLNYFKRHEEDVRGMLESAGYTWIGIQPLKQLCPEEFDDVCTQHLIRAIK
jgi:SAM-dependent methyltransferase